MYTQFKGNSLTDSRDGGKKPISELAEESIKGFLDEISRNENIQKAAQQLGHINKDDVMRWHDNNELDLMHHVIIQNNAEAVEYLLSRGFFQRWPIDIAAEESHLACVMLILDQCVIKDHPEFVQYPYIALACVQESVASLQLICTMDKPKQEDIKKAIEVALMKASAPCLDILLQQKVNTSNMFNRKNFFHMLYTFSQTNQLGDDGYRRLPEVTQILIKHTHSVKATIPPNTYPLYSLINNSLCIHDYTNTQHYVMCLRLLLEAGADPNFDETEEEKTLNSKGFKTEHGRPSYSSAMQCLLETVESFTESLQSKALAVRFIVQMTEVLIQNKAQINSQKAIGDKTSNRYGTLLHQFSKFSVKFGVDSSLFKYLLRQGADPDARDKTGKSVINTYLDILFSDLKEFSSHSTPPDHTADVEKMLALSLFMSRACVKESLKIFVDDYSNHPPKNLKKYVRMVIKDLDVQVKAVWPLKRMCRMLIWELCKRDAAKVQSLPIDIESKTYILPSI